MEYKKSKLTLKRIDESTGKPSIMEIHSLDEVMETGNYTVIARNVSPECGFPKIAALSEENICCEAMLQVTCLYADNIHPDIRIYGQQLIIPNEKGCDIYVRKLTSKGARKWRQLATEVVKPIENDTHMKFKVLSVRIEQLSEQIHVLNARQADIKTRVLNLLLKLFSDIVTDIKQIKQTLDESNNAPLSLVP